ncbi:uncharacterized protein FA14DRAFT_160210 [Meira miltonrushii]|uniref:Uncharacterized protein n=1 Tax=Meira miltonrushii TaxID=1280837 RepID=A0A316VAT9_9BASI|nr:uncharacterized protein FA14DRAFT_160210 [Meira miltonrushii]PWN34727.1 hypothetical protein FA14DRAFT_160210 [Meira miltonrushii]
MPWHEIPEKGTKQPFFGVHTILDRLAKFAENDLKFSHALCSVWVFIRTMCICSDCAYFSFILWIGNLQFLFNFIRSRNNQIIFGVAFNAYSLPKTKK